MKQFISVACKDSENWQFESTFRPLNGTQAFAWPNFVELKSHSYSLKATERHAFKELLGKGPGPAVGQRCCKENSRVRKASLVCSVIRATPGQTGLGEPWDQR